MRYDDQSESLQYSKYRIIRACIFVNINDVSITLINNI